MTLLSEKELAAFIKNPKFIKREFNNNWAQDAKDLKLWFNSFYPNFFDEVSNITKHNWKYKKYSVLFSKYFTNLGFVDPSRLRSFFALEYIPKPTNPTQKINLAFVIAHELVHMHWFEYIYSNFDVKSSEFYRLTRTDIVEVIDYLLLFESAINWNDTYSKKNLYENVCGFEIFKESLDRFIKRKTFREFVDFLCVLPCYN